MKKLLILLLLCSVCQGYVVDKPIMGEDQLADNDLARGLVGVWLFNDRPGVAGRTYDLSGNGNHGTLVGSVSPEPGLFGPGLLFGGNQDYISVPIIFGHPCTLITWVKFNVIGGSTEYLSADGSDRHNFQLDGGILRYDNFPPGGYGASGTTTINTDEWYQLAASVPASGVAVLYVNGLDDTSANQAESPAAGMTGYRLGGRNAADDFDGVMELFYIYNRALTAGEVASLFAAPFQMFEQQKILIAAAAAPVGGGQVIIIMSSIAPPLVVIILLAGLFWYTGRKAA